MSAIAFMSVNKMLDVCTVKTVSGSVDGAVFYKFVQTSSLNAF